MHDIRIIILLFFIIAYAAMKTATMDCFSFGFVSASWMKRSVMRAT